jgi:hypothetical protein
MQRDFGHFRPGEAVAGFFPKARFVPGAIPYALFRLPAFSFTYNPVSGPRSAFWEQALPGSVVRRLCS